MTGIHKAVETGRSAIGVMRRIGADAVVAPAMFAQELDNGHKLQVRDSQINKVIEALDCGVESSCRREGTDVQFIDRGGGQRASLPMLVGPVEFAGIDVSRGSVD